MDDIFELEHLIVSNSPNSQGEGSFEPLISHGTWLFSSPMKMKNENEGSYKDDFKEDSMDKQRLRRRERKKRQRQKKADANAMRKSNNEDASQSIFQAFMFLGMDQNTTSGH